MKVYEMTLCGLKNWKIKGREVIGEHVEITYRVKASNYKIAQELALKDFKKRGYFFEEIDLASINFIEELTKDLYGDKND